MITWGISCLEGLLLQRRQAVCCWNRNIKTEINVIKAAAAARQSVQPPQNWGVMGMEAHQFIRCLAWGQRVTGKYRKSPNSIFHWNFFLLNYVTIFAFLPCPLCLNNFWQAYVGMVLIKVRWKSNKPLEIDRNRREPRVAEGMMGVLYSDWRSIYLTQTDFTIPGSYTDIVIFKCLRQDQELLGATANTQSHSRCTRILMYVKPLIFTT